MEFFYQYDFEVKYIQGKENVVVDALSHRCHVLSSVTLEVDLKGQILASFPSDN